MDKVNILVVDDRPEGLLAVQAVLDSPGYNVVTASSGNEALRRLLTDDFAVILMDVQMPIMNGFETASIIKTRDKSSDIPIIFMSAINQDEQYVYQGYSVGAVDYILKPFDPFILRSKVGIFVDIFRKKRQIDIQTKKLQENEQKIHAQAIDRLEVESLRRYQTLADSIPHMVFRIKENGQIEYSNRSWFEYTGLPQRSLERFTWDDIVHKDDVEKLKDSLLLTNHENVEVECRIVNRNGEFRWHVVRLLPEFVDNESNIKSWLGTATDIEDRKRDEVAQKFLSDAGELLVSTLDPVEVISKISEAAVPYLGDWCAFDLMSTPEESEQVIIKHRDKGMEEEARELHSSFFHDSENKSGVTALIESGQPYFRDRVDGGTFLSIPLMNKDKVFGVMTFVYSVSQRKFTSRDISTLQDLGKRIALALENARLYKMSQTAIEARNDFMSIASHELNTPITSLKLQLQMIKKAITLSKDGVFPIDRFQKSVDSSVKQVNRLINLVSILLDVTRIQSGKFAYHFTEFSANDLIEEIIERHHELIHDSDCSINIQDSGQITVYWDRTRIEQVITNLLTNAIKYAPGKIQLEMKEVDQNVIILIKDSGKGIPQKKLEKIFDRFERATNQETVTGLGLGLFIVKQIAEGHSGTVEVESVVDQGTVFKVILPKRAVLHQQINKEPPEVNIQ